MDDFNSPVVKEIPIFISQSLSNKILVYQYPTSDGLRPDNATIVECSMKDDHEVTLKLERDVTSRNYSKSRGEQMAINADGNKSSEEMEYPRQLMDKEVLVSKVLSDKNVAVGIFQDGELHLTHAASTVLLRPSYKHLDMADKRLKQESKDKGEGEAEEEEEELQQVTVKFARQESDRAKKAREKSFSFMSKQSAKQTWRPMDYHDSTSVRAELELGKLFCQAPSEKVSDQGATGIARLDALVAESPEGQVRSSHGVTLTRLNGTLVDRIKAILISARVIDMGTLNRLLGEPAAANELQDRIKVVQHVAVLVQGCWVVQSDVIIHKEASPNGVPAALARSARDYILYQFTRNRTVTRSQLMEVIKVPGDVLKTMLEEVAVLKDKEWEFKLPTDVQFAINHREVEQRQQAKWDLRLEQILAGLRPVEAGATPPTRQRRRSGRESMCSDTEGPDNRRNHPKIRRNTRTSESKPVDSVT